MIGATRGKAKIPAAVFAVIGSGIALSFLGMLVISKLEAMHPGVQFLCAADGPTFCYTDNILMRALPQNPLVFCMTFVLVPTLLAGCVAYRQRALPPGLHGWTCAAMWLAVFCYLAVPLTYIFLSPIRPNPAAPSAEWVLYPSLSVSSSGGHLDAIFAAVRINKAAIAILVITILVGSIAIGLARPRPTPFQIVRVGFATLIVWVIWMAIAKLSDAIRMISLDRNFGTTFFDPAAPPDDDFVGRVFDLFQGPEAWNAAAILGCLALCLAVRGTQS